MIFLGLGVFAVAIQQVGVIAMRKRAEHTEWLIASLGHSHGERHPANLDRPSEPQDKDD